MSLHLIDLNEKNRDAYAKNGQLENDFDHFFSVSIGRIVILIPVLFLFESTSSLNRSISNESCLCKSEQLASNVRALIIKSFVNNVFI